MRAYLIAVGERMPAWVQQGWAEYAKRLSRELPLQLVEISTKSRDPARTMTEEGAALLAAIPKGAHTVALDGRGKPWSSEELAQQLARWRMQGKDLAFLVGGADGLAPDVFARADQRWSLGPLTLPHPLVRIVVAEQLYRAASLLANHPYHRA
ncbi:MAG: 23S rRNA (pseudouridine(1915)-N(3))-methyltransferase RlmH [Xanthomonadaceae bacterium]|nr:23S rRNA (pseudouridine(1915)-N(3))-methyltransferase RlmH [Xanthomonadaceae bacterium]MDE1960035.1 23S rRNA (pseudouridine(1915)-N(3))-methyltransferase RlmH [Xanthomonadaceae bacterium]MDE2084094.1 23S rRNA (pseudouridine(1915)-N(3))-methyltransferase RlmH [Xanthomonadaceae bacterium]MDE2256402.1 23S rRNA (pseudouridine(1915)-N(3))-methyltransferase RlmH [Xanthomonadaceae bacterium]